MTDNEADRLKIKRKMPGLSTFDKRSTELTSKAQDKFLNAVFGMASHHLLVGGSFLKFNPHVTKICL